MVIILNLTKIFRGCGESEVSKVLARNWLHVIDTKSSIHTPLFIGSDPIINKKSNNCSITLLISNLPLLPWMTDLPKNK